MKVRLGLDVDRGRPRRPRGTDPASERPSIIRCTSNGFVSWRAAGRSTHGEVGTKRPSITSKWIHSAPAPPGLHGSARRPKSAERSDGAMTIPLTAPRSPKPRPRTTRVAHRDRISRLRKLPQDRAVRGAFVRLALHAPMRNPRASKAVRMRSKSRPMRSGITYATSPPPRFTRMSTGESGGAIAPGAMPCARTPGGPGRRADATWPPSAAFRERERRRARA